MLATGDPGRTQVTAYPLSSNAARSSARAGPINDWLPAPSYRATRRAGEDVGGLLIIESFHCTTKSAQINSQVRFSEPYVTDSSAGPIAFPPTVNNAVIT